VIEIIFDPNVPADDEQTRVLFAWTYRPEGDPLGIDILVYERADGTFRLEWGDRVANVWTENYADPATAFARLAVLMHSVRTAIDGESRFFRHQPTGDDVFTDAGAAAPEAFVADARRFMDGQLKGAICAACGHEGTPERPTGVYYGPSTAADLPPRIVAAHRDCAIEHAMEAI
jgi:hypothetical protein